MRDLLNPCWKHTHTHWQTHSWMLCSALKARLQIHPTCFAAPQGGNIVHALLKHFFLPISLFFILLLRMLFFYLSNIINMFQCCQSKKLKLTYNRAPHPSYISRSRMGWGWRAKINVWECFSCKSVCAGRERERERRTEDWMNKCGLERDTQKWRQRQRQRLWWGATNGEGRRAQQCSKSLGKPDRVVVWN